MRQRRRSLTQRGQRLRARGKPDERDQASERCSLSFGRRTPSIMSTAKSLNAAQHIAVASSLAALDLRSHPLLEVPFDEHEATASRPGFHRGHGPTQRARRIDTADDHSTNPSWTLAQPPALN